MRINNLKCVLVLFILLLLSLTSYNSVAVDEDEQITISSGQYDKAYRYNTHGWIYLHIEGEPYDRGYQHGYLLANEIVDIIQRWQNIFPQKNSWKFHRIYADKFFWRNYPEEYKQEIQGIADGVKDRDGKIDGRLVDYKDILAINEMYEMMSRFRTYSVYPFRFSSNWMIQSITSLVSNMISTAEEEHKGKCSAFLATGDATVDGRIVATQSTFGGKGSKSWWHNYISERFNVLLDIQPTQGHRMLIATSPGYIWSDEDWYQNDAGMVLMETTLMLGKSRFIGDPVVVRARKAIQYSDSIDEMVDYFLTNNNGLFANDWLMADTKTGEIASLELALRNYGLTRTKNGYIWSCNNPKNDKVRWELYSIFGFGVIGRLVLRDFRPSNRDIKFEELLEKHYGEINVDIAKQIMSTKPICGGSTDCKITDSSLIDNFGLWAFMGKPNGEDFISNDYPFDKEKPGYTDLPACGWVNIYALSNKNTYYDEITSYNGEDGVKALWELETKSYELRDQIYSSPALEDDSLYINSWNGGVYSIDASSGTKNWENNLGFNSSSSPIIEGDILYLGSNGGIYAFDKDTGDIIWMKEIGGISSKPISHNGFVYCGSHDGNVYAFDSENGDLKWKFGTNEEIYSSPMVSGNVLYIGSNDGYLYAIDVKTRDLEWKYETGGPVCSSPIVFNNMVYFGSWDNNVYALNAKTGELEWEFTTGWGVDSSPALYKGTVFVGSEDNNMYALNADDGKLKWFFSTNAGIKSSPTVYGGFVFFGSSDGRFYALNMEDGDLEWSVSPDYHIQGVYNYVTKPIDSSPVAYDGKVFFGSTDGKVYCFDAQTFEKEPVEKEIRVPTDTWVFMIISLIIVTLITALYLVVSRRKSL